MDMEAYRERIRTLPVRELHTLAEEDPAAAMEWAGQEAALADAWAREHGAGIDEKERDEIFARIMERLRRSGAAPE